jgi:hypothetical protein
MWRDRWVVALYLDQKPRPRAQDTSALRWQPPRRAALRSATGQDVRALVRDPGRPSARADGPRCARVGRDAVSGVAPVPGMGHVPARRVPLIAVATPVRSTARVFWVMERPMMGIAIVSSLPQSRRPISTQTAQRCTRLRLLCETVHAPLHEPWHRPHTTPQGSRHW